MGDFPDNAKTAQVRRARRVYDERNMSRPSVFAGITRAKLLGHVMQENFDCMP